LIRHPRRGQAHQVHHGFVQRTLLRKHGHGTMLAQNERGPSWDPFRVQ
jgi:hypothetical protein